MSTAAGAAAERPARLGRFAHLVLAASLILHAGCGSGVQGTYVGTKGHSFFDQIELEDAGKVVVTLVGVAYDATFEVKGSSVIVNNGGQLHELKIENGCLVDAIGGTYCKAGGSAGVATSEPAGAPRGYDGEYEARGPNGGAMTIRFTGTSTFDLQVSAPGANDARQGTYRTEGDHVMLQIAGDREVLDLTRRGDALEGSLGGDQIRFVKR